MIDSHVHLDSINREGLETMALGDIVAVVADASPVPGLAPSAQAVFEFYERTLNFDSARAAEFFIDTYVLVGINMLFVSHEYNKVLQGIPKYLEHEKVVGVGEIGLDPRSPTCPDLVKQEEIVRAGLSMAKEYGKIALLHTPPTERTKWIETYFKFIDGIGIDPQKVVISHADSSIIKMITDFGSIAAITVQPWRNITPEDTAEMLKDAPLDQVLVNSDTVLRLRSDVLGVPKTALEMRRLGFKDEDIKKVVFDNPRRVFNLFI